MLFLCAALINTQIMITDRLRGETRPQHEAMEKVGFSDKIMSGQLSLEDYKILIRNNYIMNQIIEKELRQ